MPYANPEMAKLKQREWYMKNKEKHNEKSRLYYINNRERMRECGKENYKQNKSIYIDRANKYRKEKLDWFWNTVGPYCRHCGYSKREALQLHHLDPSQKDHAKDCFALWVRKISFDALKTKLQEHSFVILCANCHIELHSGLWELSEDCWDDSSYFVR